MTTRDELHAFASVIEARSNGKTARVIISVRKDKDGRHAHFRVASPDLRIRATAWYPLLEMALKAAAEAPL